nr:PREDICTED: protein CROC-4 [Rhinolophus sinicus]
MKRFVGTKEGQVWIAGHVPELERPPPPSHWHPLPSPHSFPRQGAQCLPAGRAAKEREASEIPEWRDRCYVIAIGSCVLPPQEAEAEGSSPATEPSLHRSPELGVLKRQLFVSGITVVATFGFWGDHS